MMKLNTEREGLFGYRELHKSNSVPKYTWWSCNHVSGLLSLVTFILQESDKFYASQYQFKNRTIELWNDCLYDTKNMRQST